MLDALSRWFSGSPAPAVKAETGPFVYNISNFPPLSSIANNPVTLIEEAQALFRANPWVAAAERAIYGRYVEVGFHLEDSAGNTVDRKTGGPAQAVIDFLSQPSPDRSRLSLWRLTLRHMGLTGNAFWYLDERLPDGPPLSIRYINPARMTPVTNEAERLIGWVMDHPQNPVSQRRNLRQPVPFELDELRHFVLDEPDWGHYGVGIAEAAYQTIKLEELSTKHVSSVMATGGRLAGLISPKANVTISDEAWASLVRDWRNIASDPDSAKRLQIVKGPVDFTNTAANPAELQMKEMLTLGRDNVFAAWGVPVSQGAGVVAATGLNSGEAMKFEEAAMWQGPIDFRSGPFEEKVQSVIDLFGLGLRLVVDTPAFDDQAPLFANAEKATKQPLTNNERRALLGFDPLEDDELGKAIFIEQSMTKLTLDEPAPPANVLPFGRPPTSQEDATPEDSGLGEAASGAKAGLRENTASLWEPKLQAALQTFLVGQANAIANRVRNNHSHIVGKPVDTDSWWNARQWDKALNEVLEPLLTQLADSVGRRVRPQTEAKAGWIDTVLEYVRKAAGLRISGINQTTRDSVARLIAHGVEQGLSPSELAQTIRDGAAFDEARAEMIARTETATAYNDAALSTYRHFEVAEVQAIDGDTDEECAARNGNIYSVDEAMGITDHPNGTLDWVPVTAAKATAEVSTVKMPKMEFHFQQDAAIVNVPKPDPVEVTVNVPKPDPVVVNVPEVKPAQVTVNVPEQAPPVVTVEAAKATGPQEVVVTSMPPRIHHVVRRKDGTVEGSTEVDR